MNNFNEKLFYYKEIFNNYLNNFINNLPKSIPSNLLESIKYSLTGSAKRLRPILLLSSSEMLGVSIEKTIKFALALECVHNYSLVHDDLPCMDNDDYRHGQLSTHKKFGEDIGVLTGDALLNLAFEICLKDSTSLEEIKSTYLLANYAGINGMIAGQVLDLENEKLTEFNEERLLKTYKNKTSNLLTAPLLISSIFAGEKYYNILEEFGCNLGILFQITDDILDVEGTLELIGKTPNKDKDANKLTFIKGLGLEKTKEICKEYYVKCKNLIANLENSAFLSDLLDYIYNRNN
ncbi:MAG: polyprenyl synthetase family protein [Clostridia bacterium]|nr:polyprenyl synthetase family protein [Clostridia bacterium]